MKAANPRRGKSAVTQFWNVLISMGWQCCFDFLFRFCSCFLFVQRRVFLIFIWVFSPFALDAGKTHALPNYLVIAKIRDNYRLRKSPFQVTILSPEQVILAFAERRQKPKNRSLRESPRSARYWMRPPRHNSQ
jgi:hypothetical protein